MIREIITPHENQYTLNIPDSFIGKKIEVLAYEVKEYPGESDKSVEALFAKFEGLTFDSQGTYSFDRNEATDYE